MISISEANHLGKYLGAPLISIAPRKAEFQDIVDNVKSKLTAWKLKHLTFAGRVTLSKSVIQALLLYTMMSASILKACIEETHKLQRSFIWEQEEHSKKVHAISWDVVTKPKNLGGLGIRRLDVVNKACIMKLGWEIRNGAQQLWCKLLKGKYDRNYWGSDALTSKITASNLWKTIVKTWPLFNDFIFRMWVMVKLF